jgi:sulfate-transporting ATPase
VREFIQYLILGIGPGAVYALLGVGIVLIYRGSGVVNFAQGVFALAGAVVFVETRARGVPLGVALLLAVIAGLVFGALIQNIVLWRLRRAAPVIRIIATLGIFIAAVSGAALHYGAVPVLINQFLPQHIWSVDKVTIESDRVILFGIAAALTVILSFVQRRTLIGVATRAAAEDDVSASILGWSPNMLASFNWALGGALGALAGALIVPLTGLIVENLGLLIVPALAAALIGGFRSLGFTFLGAIGVGVAQTLTQHYWTQPGAGDAVPFLIIIIVLVISGRSLPLRSHLYEKLPSLGRGTLRPIPIAVLTIVSFIMMSWVFNVTWQDAFTASLAEAILLLSVVVVTGYAGQLSLAQLTLAGLGAYVAGRLVAAQGWPFWAAFIAGILAAVPIGLAFAIPALRTRGVNLAVVTLGLAVTVNAVLFQNVNYTGGLQGTATGDTKLFGLDINAITHPNRWGVFVLILFVVCAILVANLRRSASGRRMIAIRENERAAAALGVSVRNAKFFAFAIGAVVATVAGYAIGFGNTSVVYTNFDPLSSIYSTAYAVIGGVGYVAGPLLGSMLVSGGVGSLFNALIPGLNNWLGVIGGVFVVIILMLNPDGLVPSHMAAFRQIAERMERRGKRAARVLARRDAALGRLVGRSIADHEVALSSASSGGTVRVEPKSLEITGLTVRFGGVVAVDDVDVQVGPGEVVGLIGPNGAGKTTLIDAASGFVRASQGSIRLGSAEITGLSAHRRVTAGLARSWQSLELFEDVSVLENMLIASEQSAGTRWQPLRSLAWPGKGRLGGPAATALKELQLTDTLGSLPGDLSYGRRRLVGVARTVAVNPSVVLLDEPAAGLSAAETDELGRAVRHLADGWGMAVLLIEHDVDLVMRICDRIIVLDFGKKIAEGKPADIRASQAVRAAYLGTETAAEAVDGQAGAASGVEPTGILRGPAQ